MLVVATVATSSVGVARAQSAAAPSAQQPQAAGHKPPVSLEGFRLTPSQKAKIDSVAMRHSSEIKAVGEMFATDPEEGVRRMVALRTKIQKEVRVMLTPEQRVIFDRNVAEMNALMPIGPH